MTKNPTEDRGFLSRWSRRKSQAREQAEANGQTDADPVDTPAMATRHPASSDTASGGLPSTQDAVSVGTPSPQRDDVESPLDTPRLPTLDDVKNVLPDGDFSPFMARGVPTDVRNAAMKKLFTDPHYNVMDGLDIYIDDYSQMEPLPANMLGRLVSARMLNLVDDPEAEAGTSSTSEMPGGHESHIPPGSSVIESAAPGDADVATPATTVPVNDTEALPTTSQSLDSHADTDLQLQPHDAATGGSSGRRT